MGFGTINSVTGVDFYSEVRDNNIMNESSITNNIHPKLFRSPFIASFLFPIRTSMSPDGSTK